MIAISPLDYINDYIKMDHICTCIDFMRLVVLINVMNTETIVCADCTGMFTATLQKSWNYEFLFVKGIQKIRDL